MTADEWAVHKAFYDLTVKERDAAWVECAHLRAEVERLRERLEVRIQHGHNLRTMLESATETERAAVVAWLRNEVGSAILYRVDDVSMDSASAGVAMLLAHVANAIERGEHRREEGA